MQSTAMWKDKRKIDDEKQSFQRKSVMGYVTKQRQSRIETKLKRIA
jgi:hypothetical protein